MEKNGERENWRSITREKGIRFPISNNKNPTKGSNKKRTSFQD